MSASALPVEAETASAAEPPAPGLFELLRLLASYLAPYRAPAAFVGAALLLEMAFNAALPMGFKYFLDHAVAEHDRRDFFVIVAALAVGLVLVTGVGLVRDRVSSRIVTRVVADLRLRLFSHLQRLSMGFYSRKPLGDLLANFSSGLSQVQDTLQNAIPWAVTPGLDLLASVVLLFVLDWRLALVAMLIFPVSLVGPFLVAPHAGRASAARYQEEAAALAAVQENLSGQAVVKAFGMERRVQAEFGARVDGLARSAARAAFLGQMIDRSGWFGVLALHVTVLGGGAWMCFEGLLSVGSLAAFMALFLQLGTSLNYVTVYAPSVINLAGPVGRIEALLAERPAVEDAPGAVALAPLARAIEFRHVSFSYAGERQDLQHVTLSIPRGASVAFVGPSGAGKSTVLQLLLRFHEPTQGALTVDDVDLRQASQDSWRGQIGVVFQESFLFNTTVRECIRLGRPDATDAEVEAAAREAEIHDVILGLSRGYDTLVGERGAGLSGGQRQRIGIARALVRHPQVLFLDEATSALDPVTDAAISKTLARVGRGRTVISVTHRLSSAIEADRIFVLESGRLCEQGRHPELVAQGGLYTQLWEKQSGFVLSEGGEHVEVSARRLRGVPILRDLPEPFLERAASLFVTEHFAAGRAIVERGERGDRFYIVVRGTVEVSHRVERAGRLAALTDGDYFGEIALVRDEPRSATVRAVTPTICISLSREHFLGLLEAAPEVRAAIEATIAQRVSAQA
ncbi:MAG: ABC transporter transmembrane domain-containing protein [Vicinamibacteria bacterium]|nr:ABC transporter transmembrane domain-containing protein [Vicinamibacteria bacterium]